MADGSVVIDVDLNESKAKSNLESFKKELNGIDGKGFDNVNSSATKASVSIKDIATSLGLVQVASKAIDMLKSSLDGAISLYDTINNFPKVMQNLGFSAEESSASVQKLRDNIQGLPTTLDEIVSNTQILATSMGDLDKATDLSIALNNMFLASGKGANEANRAFTQFTQMLSTGKVDMMSWRTMLEVAPAQLNQVAQAMLGTNANANDLYDALQSGTVSFDDFNNAIMELNQNGINGFASFEQQAKDATGGIGTAITNLHTAFKNGLEKIIRETDEWLSANNLPTISEMINNIKDDVSNAFKIISENMDTIMPVITTVIDILELLAPLIVGVVAAIGAYNAIMAVTEGVTNLVTAAQTALNVVMNLNPFVLIAVAIAGLVAAFITLWNTNEDFRNAVIAIWEAVKQAWNDFVDGIKELIDKIAQDFADLKQWLSDTWDAIVQKIEEVWNNIKNFFLVTIPEIFNSIVEWFQQLPGKIWEFFSDIWNKAVEWGAGLLDRGIEAASNFINNVIDWISQLPSKIWEWLTNAASKVVEWGSNIVSNAKQSASNLVSGFIDTITSLPSKLYNWGVDCINNFVNGIKNMIGKVRDAASSVASAVADFLHFSEPDVGPLAHASTFMPDMMKLYAKGIKDNLPMLEKMALKAAEILNLPELFSSAEVTAMGGYPQNNTYNNGVSVAFNGGINWSGTNNIEEVMDMIQDVINRRGYRLG